MHKELELFWRKKRFVALVDPTDFESVSIYKWWVNAGGYAESTHYGRRVLMHRLLMEPPSDKVVDHINGNKLDNQRSNLRIVPGWLNSRFALLKPGAPKNAVRCVHGKRWAAGIVVNRAGRRNWVNLGTYRDRADAVAVYNDACDLVYGELADLKKLPTEPD